MGQGDVLKRRFQYSSAKMTLWLCQIPNFLDSINSISIFFDSIIYFCWIIWPSSNHWVTFLDLAKSVSRGGIAVYLVILGIHEWPLGWPLDDHDLAILPWDSPQKVSFCAPLLLGVLTMRGSQHALGY